MAPKSTNNFTVSASPSVPKKVEFGNETKPSKEPFAFNAVKSAFLSSGWSASFPVQVYTLKSVFVPKGPPIKIHPFSLHSILLKLLPAKSSNIGVPKVAEPASIPGKLVKLVTGITMALFSTVELRNPK